MKAKPHQFSSTLPTLSSKDHPPVAAHARQCFGVKRFVARRAALRDAGLSPKMELRILLSLPAFSTSCHVSAILLGLSAISGFAGDATWNGGTASWSTAAGWTTSPVGNYPKNGNAGQNWNATLNNGSAALDVEDILIQQFTLTGGTVTGSFNLSATGNLAWTGGGMAGAGTTSVAGTGSTISGSATRGLDRTLNNTGTMTNSMPDGAEPFYFGWKSAVTPGVLNNSGIFNLTAGGDFAHYNPNAGHAINNSGTWNISGAGTTSSVNPGIAFNNTGAVTAASGTFAMNGGGTSTGSFAASAGATLRRCAQPGGG
jgi:hypothetical protein